MVTLMKNSADITLILGGGFAGLFTALRLSRQHYPQKLLLIDREKRFTFKPLLYEFLSGEMTADQIWPCYKELLQGSSVTFIQDTVQSIDLHQQQVKLASGSHQTYSHLVLALGSTTRYFDVKGAPENSFSFRTGQDALVLSKHLHVCLQQAVQIDEPQQRCSLLTVVVIGAGSAGVELAATLADLLPDWYAVLGGNPQEIRVVLLGRGVELLSGARGESKSSLRSCARTALQRRRVPVELCLETEVIAIDANQVEFKRNEQFETLQTATVVWTAGIATNPFIKALPIPQEHRDHHGRLQVTPTLQLPDFPEVFAAGDCVVCEQNPLPPTAQAAYQQGEVIAQNLKAIAEGTKLSPAEVKLSGTFLKLGLGESAANLLDRFEVEGQLGHLIRQATYAELLPTPVHNLKATTKWMVDEIFQRHNSPGNLANIPVVQERQGNF